MKSYKHLVKIVVTLLFISLVTACGYKPSAKYAREVTGDSISTSVVISAEDPENTVLIKDAVDSAIIEIFHASLKSKADAQTHLTITLSEPSYSPIRYNSDGYVVAYRATTTLKILRVSKESAKNYTAQGSYDFSIVANSILTDQERFDAIKFSSVKAITSFVAQVSAEGAKKEKE
jgi:uncharacterized lipoprotein YehR (DUF1307 family)